jgi:hypothetical protein
MVTAIGAWQYLQQIGLNKTLSEVTSALGSIDQNAIVAQQRARVTYSVWDGVSPINGVAAETILARPDVPPGGKIYLLYVDGTLRFLQPFNPFQAGIVALTDETVNQVAEQHADSVARDMATQVVLEQLVQALAG